MAITGAVTLAQIYKTSNNPLEKLVVKNLLRFTDLLADVPFANVDSFENVAVRWTSLPTPAFRKINAGYTASVGDVEQVTETIYPAGGEFLIDRLYDMVGNLIIDPRVLQIQMHMKALALTLNDYFINGDHTADPDTFEGLKKRVAGMPSRQSVYFAGAAAAALDPTASAANARAFFDKFDEMYKRCNNGNVSAIFANEGMELGIARVLRYAQISGGNFLDTTRDVWGREVTTFRGTPIIDVGYKKDQTTEIITDAETAGDAGTDATSIYMASYDNVEGIHGIQLDGLDFYDPLTGGELEATPTGKVRYEWPLGLASFGSYGIVRGRNVEGASNWT